MNPLDALTFEKLLWLVPVLFALHNLEETPGMARWSKRINARVQVTTPQFASAVMLLTLVVIGMTVLAAQPDAPLWTIHLLLLAQMVILVNVFVPHVALAVRFRSYNPGLVTAVLLNLPFSLVLFQRALAAAVVDWGGLVLMQVAAPILMIVAVRVSLGVGGWVEKRVKVGRS